MEKEVLTKHRKALMLFGSFHLFHSNSVAPRGLESAVQKYEKDFPGVTMVIAINMVFDFSTPPPDNNQLQARMAQWPVPSLVRDVKNTWLGDVNNNFFSKMADAYLYLGPVDLILAEPRPAEIFLDKDYMAELRRRAAIIGDPFVTSQTDPQQISDKHFSPFLYIP
jgi:hypothetical protein